MRLLSKSRFRLALECPNKLFYVGKPDYPDHTAEDEFLQALAKGGFQVEELARRYFPGGQMVHERANQQAADKTREWLANKEDVILYEAAFLHESLFARTDILVKQGNEIHILEVKAKSVDGTLLPEEAFLTKKGKISSGWRMYLWDLAFQAHIVQSCYPQHAVRSFLVLADTSARSSRDGLNQLFKIDPNHSDRIRDAIVVPEGLKREDLGDPVLIQMEVSGIIESIHAGQETFNDKGAFNDLVHQFAQAYAQDEEIPARLSTGCKTCTFYATEEEKAEGKICGFSRCWSRETDLNPEDLLEPKVYDVWDFRGTEKRFEAGVYLARDLSEEDIKIKSDPGRLSRTERQWAQVESIRQGSDSPYILREELAEELNCHQYPLHFIDFETHMSPLPYHRGRRPYEQIAFQFSHHVLHANGQVEHREQYLCGNADTWPNYLFLRALRSTLEKEGGTIFRYAHHENSVLRQILEQLATDETVPDREELMAFVEQITEYKTGRKTKITGLRNMVDLKKIIMDYYYNPLMGGSNSLKRVLPAMIHSIPFLQDKYSRPIGQAGIHSCNMPGHWRWIKPEEEGGLDPYAQLPPLFPDDQQTHRYLQDLKQINEGGAAMVAYGKLQYQEISEADRRAIMEGLLRYCELDTLAMVMVYEGLREVACS